ncbi:anthranilate phosphoribosyltransferase family protein [Leptolyngbya cf. ectocarpi LEGE 11479]|uniref:Anthranilate phosphoribosyltransferase family protein n=1 Tax=Leptolyngbya cf. ectocarpi LEGE 11479 TaxID=1828722 RepID=A0A928ZUX7_LEPEC|nr:anthranilate phosphoribosyltransferase family protein [Leptolyngbya ectocarpi]MBE9067918.1 anthranilate phosphoribosyltransferase family protein [Leptolyngbya cf. ectocarpi LEGE 11479]
MSNVFRDLLKKVGSGTHTSKHLSREESALATRMLLEQTATPAQIGAFMIAQRIKRPSIPELAGMLDCYDQMGGRLRVSSKAHPAMVLNTPYDGRQRHAPVTPLTALILASAGVPAILHGGDRMPTKMGLPLVDIWQSLGLTWQSLSLAQTQQVFDSTQVGFIYIPQHFAEAHQLVPYREQIGKRPTLATVELMWSPCQGRQHVVSGFVHPPTEDRTQETYQLRHTYEFTTVKGLEGSCDLPRSRTAIIGMGSLQDGESVFERLLLHPRDYGFEGADPDLNEEFAQALESSIHGEPGELTRSVIWNGGFYLWRAGRVPTIAEGIQRAQTLLETGQVVAKREQVRDAIATALNHHLSTV